MTFAGVPNDGALWAPFLEKAWAKVIGNYEFIAGGDSTEAIAFFLNVPFDTYVINDPSDLNGNITDIWEIIKESDSEKFIMTCDTSGGNDTTINTYGLANGHAYTLISAYELKNKKG